MAMAKKPRATQTRKTGGRPYKFSLEIQDLICGLLERGNYLETAAACAGISKDTLFRWLKAGARESKGPLRGFSDSVKRAMAKSEASDVDLIGRAALENWQAAAWRLERKYPERWGRRDRMTLAGDPDAPVVIRTAWGGAEDAGATGSEPKETS